MAQLHLVRRMWRYTLRICLVVFVGFSAIAASIFEIPETEWKARFAQRLFPDYPRCARARHLTGSGVFRMRVDKQGRVTTVTVLKSTGHKELDSLAVEALSRWRGRPGPKWDLHIPITFRMDVTITRKSTQTRRRTGDGSSYV
jgi:TonB family protein